MRSRLRFSCHVARPEICDGAPGRHERGSLASENEMGRDDPNGRTSLSVT